MTFFGSWFTVFDTSGQIRRDNDSRVLTLAGVAIANEISQEVRAMVDTRLGPAPKKWRDGGLLGFQTVQGTIIAQTLRVAVTHITGISNDRWKAFWDEGRRKASELEALTGQSANFAAGDSTSRLLLFSIIFAHCFAHVLKQRGWSAPPPAHRRDAVEFTAVFDTDINNQEARSVLSEILRYSATSGRFAKFASMDISISDRFQTEQEEPLLLLADYVAGAFNHVHPDAVIGKPVAPLGDVQKAVEGFRSAMGPRLQEVDLQFDEIHPLTGMWDTPIVQ